MGRRFLSGVSLLALLAGTNTAIAQQADDEVTVLERILIGSTKLEQDILKVPAYVEISDAEDISNRKIDNIDELDRIFPNLAIDGRSSGVYANFSIRGQSSPDFYNPSVQVYVDGLPYDAGTLSQSLPGGLESVEVLAGPQGTLYGRGAIGGVININTAKPGEGSPFSYAAGADNGGHNFTVRGELELADSFWADASYSFDRERPELTFLGTGADIGETEEINGSIRLRYAPDESPLDIMFTYKHNDIDSEEEHFVLGTNLEARVVTPF
ncbi:MAG: TonB-dependent receptor plug domain-containing protein, partial [Pseudomonadota bacterium]